MDNDAALKAHEREEEARENDDTALEHRAILEALHSIPDVLTAGVGSPARRIELLIRDRQQHIDQLKDTQARLNKLREGIRCARSPGSPNVFADASDTELVSEVARVVEERDTEILRSANADKYPASLEAALDDNRRALLETPVRWMKGSQADRIRHLAGLPTHADKVKEFRTYLARIVKGNGPQVAFDRQTLREFNRIFVEEGG